MSYILVLCYKLCLPQNRISKSKFMTAFSLPEYTDIFYLTYLSLNVIPATSGFTGIIFTVQGLYDLPY